MNKESRYARIVREIKEAQERMDPLLTKLTILLTSDQAKSMGIVGINPDGAEIEIDCEDGTSYLLTVVEQRVRAASSDQSSSERETP